MDDVVFKIIPLTLAYIMFTLGMDLRLSDFKVIVSEPKAFIIGIINQVFALPIIAFIIVFITQPAPELAFGILLLSFCPGGMTSNLLCYYAKGNVALSISLTGIVSILSIITLPIFIALGYQYFVQDNAHSVSMVKMGVAVFLLTTLPVVMGMFTRYKFSAFTKAHHSKFATVASLFFVLIVLIAIISNWNTLLGHAMQISTELTLMISILLLLGLLSSRLLGLSWLDAKTVAIESGIQNGATAIALSPLIVGTATALPTIALPAAIYSVLMYVIALPFILWVRNKS